MWPSVSAATGASSSAACRCSSATFGSAFFTAMAPPSTCTARAAPPAGQLEQLVGARRGPPEHEVGVAGHRLVGHAGDDLLERVVGGVEHAAAPERVDAGDVVGQVVRRQALVLHLLGRRHPQLEAVRHEVLARGQLERHLHDVPPGLVDHEPALGDRRQHALVQGLARCQRHGRRVVAPRGVRHAHGGLAALALDHDDHGRPVEQDVLVDHDRGVADVGQLELDVHRLEEPERRHAVPVLAVHPQLERQLGLGRDVRLLEAVVVEPPGVALLHEPLGRVAEEQQLVVGEAVGEVFEERRGAPGYPVRVVHEGPGLGVVDERDPRSATADAQRLLPGVGQVEGVPELVDRGPEADAGHRRVGVGVAGGRLGDERVVEDGGALPVVGPDVVEHDPAEPRPLVGKRAEERPHRPLGHVGEPAPVGLHGVVHLGVRPQRVAPRTGEGHDGVTAAAPDPEARPPVDVLDRDRLGGDRRRAVGVRADVERRHRRHAGGRVVLELHLVGVAGAVVVAHGQAGGTAAAEPHDGRRRRAEEPGAHDDDADVRVRGRRPAAVAVEDRPGPRPRPDLGHPGDPVHPEEQAPPDRAAGDPQRVAPVDVEPELAAEVEWQDRPERAVLARHDVLVLHRPAVPVRLDASGHAAFGCRDGGRAGERSGAARRGVSYRPLAITSAHGGGARSGRLLLAPRCFRRRVVDRLAHVGPPGSPRGPRSDGQA